MKQVYYCISCDKVFKATYNGKKNKCPKCKKLLSDFYISDTDYGKLSAWEKETLKINAIENVKNIKEYPLDDVLNCYDVPVFNPDIEKTSLVNETLFKNSEKMKKAVSEGTDLHSSVRNAYLKTQIQNQIIASDNFLNICKAAALKDDGKIDEEESRLLKDLEKLTKTYNKRLNKLIQ